MITLGADLSCCIFSRLHHAMLAFPFAVCSFWVLATWTPQPRMTNTSFLKAPGQQQFQEEASWPLHSVRCGRAGVGDRSPPVFPLAQLVAAPSPDGLPSRPWAARLGLERLRRVCQSRSLADRLWLGQLSCCSPAHSDLLVLVTSSCFLIWIPEPPFCF